MCRSQYVTLSTLSFEHRIYEGDGLTVTCQWQMIGYYWRHTLCVCVCSVFVCVCMLVPLSHPSNSSIQCITRAGVTSSGNLYLLQHHAVHVSLCYCHQSSKCWMMNGNNIKDAFVSQGNSGSPGEGIGGLMKHNRRFNKVGNNESPRNMNLY